MRLKAETLLACWSDKVTCEVNLAEWLRRETWNLMGSPAQVQILQLTSFFNIEEINTNLINNKQHHTDLSSSSTASSDYWAGLISLACFTTFILFLWCCALSIIRFSMLLLMVAVSFICCLSLKCRFFCFFGASLRGMWAFLIAPFYFLNPWLIFIYF